jgi:UrcA family protein
MFARHISKALLASVVAGIATFSISPAQAEMNAPRSVVVRYNDLNLDNESGRTTLNKRIAFAAQTVCGHADELSYYSRMSTAACEDRAIANASRGLVQVFASAKGTIRVAAN